MNEKVLKIVTAKTKVTPVGQKCIEAELEFEKDIDEATVSTDSFEVKDRNIVGVSVDKNIVAIRLDENDKNAATFHHGNPWLKEIAHVDEAVVEIRQLKDIKAISGETISASRDYIKSDKAIDEVADQFIQGSFGKQKYNLYIPRDYDSNKKYPLVQFIHDAAVCGSDTRLAITQGSGAVVWASDEIQEKYPCFVFAPQFEGPPIVDDDWNVDPRLEEAKAALDYVIETYSIDTDRIYTTGQSMGCMSSIVLNVRYPEFFAASFLVAGQWDDRNIKGLEKQHLWMLCSQGDAKAFPVMNQMGVAMEHAGAKIYRKVVENKLSNDEYDRLFAEIKDGDYNIIYTPYKLETVADGWHSNGGEHHMSTWQTAYNISYIHDWLFAQKRG